MGKEVGIKVQNFNLSTLMIGKTILRILIKIVGELGLTHEARVTWETYVWRFLIFFK